MIRDTSHCTLSDTQVATEAFGPRFCENRLVHDTFWFISVLFGVNKLFNVQHDYEPTTPGWQY